MHCTDSVKGCEAGDDVALGVGDAPAIHLAVAYLRVEGIGVPLRALAGGLHIVVVVDKEGGHIVARWPSFSEDHWVALSRVEIGLEAAALQIFDGEVRHFFDAKVLS